jgi:lipopolysaccharide/colanic/teichoic acid biosynthesis glycosyltransferase
MKRIIDILVSLSGIIILFPLALIVGIIIYLNDFQPVLFKQERIGRYGNPFRLLKFRSMTTKKGVSGSSFDIGDNSRVTRIGKLLRKTKIDEIPQLINVLFGDMSIVGPRPEIKLWTEVYPDRWSIVHSVKPGITDNASIEFRNEEELLANADDSETMYKDVILPRKLDLYIKYVENQSLSGDMEIIFRTIKTVIFK